MTKFNAKHAILLLNRWLLFQGILSQGELIKRRCPPCFTPPPPLPFAFIPIDKAADSCAAVRLCRLLCPTSTVDCYLSIFLQRKADAMTCPQSPIIANSSVSLALNRIYTVLSLALNRIHTVPSTPPNFADAMCFLPSPPVLLASSGNCILILKILTLFLYFLFSLNVNITIHMQSACGGIAMNLATIIP